MVRPALTVLLVAANIALHVPGASGEEHLPAFPSKGVAPFKAYPSDPTNHDVRNDYVPRCWEHFKELMNDAKAKGNEAKAKGSLLLGGTTATEACELIENYERAELKLVRFVDANSEICKIPTDYREKLKDHYEATLRSRPKRCLSHF
jgi:hypothetical protein